jgi:RNA polymerase sigma factor for flagellar operon FliA
MPRRERNQLVIDHLHIVRAATAVIASRLTQVSRDDLASAGAYALVRAAEKFDASLGVPFGAFARGRVTWALQDELRAMDWAPREVRARAKEMTQVRDRLAAALGRTPTLAEIAQHAGDDVASVRQALADAERTVASLDALDPGDIAWSGVLPEEAVLQSERDAFLRRCVDALPERKRFIVRAIYFDERSVKEVAAQLGVSHAAVSQQRAEAVRMLRDALDRHYPDGHDPARPTGGAAGASRSSRVAVDAYLDRVASVARCAGEAPSTSSIPQPA